MNNFEFFFLITVAIIAMLAFLALMRKIAEENAIERAIEQMIAKNVHIVKVELHGDMFYWFDSDTEKFIVQGKTMVECIAALKVSYINEVFLYTAQSQKQYLLVGPDFEPNPLDSNTPTEATL